MEAIQVRLLVEGRTRGALGRSAMDPDELNDSRRKAQDGSFQGAYLCYGCALLLCGDAAAGNLSFGGRDTLCGPC
jgi:hypothetical protein